MNTIPETVIVPIFIDEYIRFNREFGFFTIAQFEYAKENNFIRAYNWLNSTNNVIIFSIAFFNGYTVEDQKSYWFPLPELITPDTKPQYLTFDLKSGNYYSEVFNNELTQVFYENEIENIPSEYLEYKKEFNTLEIPNY